MRTGEPESAGNELTMITGIGGQPVDRETVDRACRERMATSRTVVRRAPKQSERAGR